MTKMLNVENGTGNVGPDNQKVFRGRLLLKVISVLALLAFSALAGLIVYAIFKKPDNRPIFYMCAFMLFVFMTLTVFIFNRTFGRIVIDDSGILLRTFFYTKKINWPQICKVKYWEAIEHGLHGGSAVEPFIALMDISGKKQLLIKSTYENEIFTCIIDRARDKNISVEMPETCRLIQSQIR